MSCSWSRPTCTLFRGKYLIRCHGTIDPKCCMAVFSLSQPCLIKRIIELSRKLQKYANQPAPSTGTPNGCRNHTMECRTRFQLCEQTCSTFIRMFALVLHYGQTIFFLKVNASSNTLYRNSSLKTTTAGDGRDKTHRQISFDIA